MSQHTAAQLLALLQAHGLTLPLLRLLALHCQQQVTGHVTLYTTQGHIGSYEQRITGKVETLENEKCSS